MNLVSSLLAVIAVISTTTTVKAKNANITEVSPTAWVQECAPAFQNVQWSRGNISYYVNYSSYDLLKKPSGLCKPEFSCAYSKCIPENYQTPKGDRIDAFVSDFLTDVDITTSTTYADIESVLGSGLNLPKKIVFPTDPSDVVNAIRHAKEEGLTISIMSTGHSYTGASTDKNSIQLNLRDYPKYSETSIVECGETYDNTPSSSTSRMSVTENDQAACKLALARGKKALVRVGGGEKFNDVANSVWAYKDNATAYAKYMMLHGVGTVGAAGGWLQGGGLGWGQERVWGLGVDQVLELEMVLADGRHIKFYPTEWEDFDGYVYPKTTKVEGLCNKNVDDDDESMWVWEECEDPIVFEDLWFAVRGGGGGTYGVVVSVKLQLHDNIPFYAFTVNETIGAKNEAFFLSSDDNATTTTNLTEDQKDELKGIVAYCKMNFSLKFLFNPSKLNVSRDDSNACGSPGFSPLQPILFCLGEDAGNAVKGSYDESMSDCLRKHTSSSSSIEYHQNNGFDFVNDMELHGPFDSLLGFVNYDSGTNENVPGQLVDDGPSILPQSRPWSGWCSAQVPESFLAAGGVDVDDADDDESILMIQNLLFETFVVHTAYGSHVTGGDVSIAHDQMNAVPMTERRSGFSSASFSGLPTDLQERLLSQFLKKTINNDESEKEENNNYNSNNNENNNFPGINEFNHMCSDSYGPLKSNTTKPCPMEYSEEEKKELCYSMQESVWGADLTRKLESIKDKVDPDGLFYCYGCIQSSSSSSSSSKSNNINKKMPSSSSSSSSSSNDNNYNNNPASSNPDDDAAPTVNNDKDESSTTSSSSSLSSLVIVHSFSSVFIMAAIVFGVVAAEALS